MNVIKTLYGSLREFKKPSILSMVFVFMEVIMECFIPLVMSFLIDEMNEGIVSNVWKYSIILVIMASLSLVFGILSGKQCAKASCGLSKNLRSDMFKKINDFSFANVDEFSSSSLVTRMTTDVTNVQMAFMMIVRTAVRSPFMLIFSVIMAFIISPKLAWIFVLIAPFLMSVLIFIIVKAMPRFRRVFKKYDKLNNSIQENISGIRTVKSYVREDYEIKKFNAACEDVKDDFVKAERIVAWNNPSMQLSINILNVVIIFLGAMVIINTSSIGQDGKPVFGDLSIGGMQSLMTYGIQTLMSLMMLSMIIVMITLAIESSRRICEVLTTTSDIKSPLNAVKDVKNGDVEFKNVAFKYLKNAKKNVLEDVNIKIESGQTIGIIGGTGSSKTTLVNLISRLYDVSEGEVLVGDVNVKDYDLKVLRDNVAVVLQKNLLFSGSIRDNLKWGNKDASDEMIKDALTKACALEFVMGFKDGLDTHIEQGGSNVSGGQKQRLCIARALLKNPKVLILDDSTSAVDTKTDAIIRHELKKAIPETTKIIIAQRISSIQDSDLIIVMDNGKISAMGKHEDLLANSLIYREVYESQNRVGGDK